VGENGRLRRRYHLEGERKYIKIHEKGVEPERIKVKKQLEGGGGGEVVENNKVR